MSEHTPEPDRDTIDLSESTLSKSAESIGLTPSEGYEAPILAFDKATPPDGGDADQS
jgi:hypothetical protein